MGRERYIVYDICSPESRPVNCELLPIFTIWFVCFGPLLIFNQPEITVNVLRVRYPQLSSWVRVERTLWGLRGLGIHPIPAAPYCINGSPWHLCNSRIAVSLSFINLSSIRSSHPTSWSQEASKARSATFKSGWYSTFLEWVGGVPHLDMPLRVRKISA